VAKTLGFKAWALFASFGLTVALVSGCNPEEPAKAPSTPPAVNKPAPKPEGKGAPAPAPAPTPKKDTEKATK
jgi:hypothetical protein